MNRFSFPAMAKKHVATFIALAFAIMLVALPAGKAHASTVQVTPTTKSSVSTSCRHLLVQLHGNNPATSSCQDTTSSKGISPLIATHPCGSNLPSPWVGLFQNAGLYVNDNQICFVGSGSANLSDYWINWPWTSWDNQVSSVNSGASGYLSTLQNGNGSQCYFNVGTQFSNIQNSCGYGWNDNASYIHIN